MHRYRSSGRNRTISFIAPLGWEIAQAQCLKVIRRRCMLGCRGNIRSQRRMTPRLNDVVLWHLSQDRPNEP